MIFQPLLFFYLEQLTPSQLEWIDDFFQPLLSFYLEQLPPSQLEWIDDFSTSSLFLPRTINS